MNTHAPVSADSFECTVAPPAVGAPSFGTCCAAGIDLGAHSAKIVLAAGRRTNRAIVAAARIALSSEMADDPVRQATALGEWLRKWSSFSVTSAACSLPARFTDYEAAPSTIDGADIEEASAAVLESALGDSAADATSDCWLTPAAVSNEADGTLHVVWTSNDVAMETPRELGRRGIPCRTLAPPIAALGMIPNADSSQSQLVVDLGAEAATFVLVEQGRGTYVRHRVAVATRAATARLAETMQVPLDAAETLLAEWGCDLDAGPLARRVVESLEPWLRGVHFELKRTLEYLDLGSPNRSVARVILCGGGSDVRGAAAWLTGRLNLPVVAAPLPGKAEWSAAEPYSSLYAQAAALALGELAQ